MFAIEVLEFKDCPLKMEFNNIPKLSFAGIGEKFCHIY